jgi:gliding motility-associated-like protein
MYATHNRAGNITYEQIGSLTYRITLITYTYIGDGVVADRPQLEIQYGDNTSQWVRRVDSIDLPDINYRWNKYVAEHTYPGPGSYEIVMEDPNRNDGVQNIPNSVTIPFSIRTTLVINPAIGYNNSPILLNPPIDFYAVNKTFIYNPAAFDPDGDSLSYKLIPCTGENGEPIENYTLPNASDTLYIDERSGDFIWEKPVEAGIFNIAILIEEWRNNIKIGTVVRDIQFETKETDNDPPEITTIDETCIKATDTLTFAVSAIDYNDDSVYLSALGGPFELPFPPFFPEVGGKPDVISDFFWDTDCSHIRKQPYQVVFRAEDNGADLNLVDNKDVFIKVIAPPVENVQLNATNNSIEIIWDQIPCAQALGYNIYRKNESVNYQPDSCDCGVPADLDFELVYTTSSVADTTFIDNNNGSGLNQGFEYCYYITSIYSDGAESYVSEEVCSPLVKGIPVITNVSIYDKNEETDSIYLAWSKPTEFDTLVAAGPYKYYIYRSNDLWGEFMQLIDSTYLDGLDDTLYYDKDAILDVHQYPYSYKVELYNDAPGNQFLIENPMIVSSVYLDLAPGDNQLELKVEKNTPWLDSVFVVYRQNPQTLSYDSIGITEELSFLDTGLVNGREYYYNLKQIGYYTEPGYIFPIENYSQKNIGIPKDTIPPCPPPLSVASICDSLKNVLTWDYPPCGDDVIKYNIYYTSNLNQDLVLIDSVNDANTYTYSHYPEASLAACYYVTAVDSFYNESDPSIRRCIDSCSFYELPNAFSPNGDSYNETWIPLTSPDLINRFVERISLTVYNRWGQPVTDEITDPMINWDGKNKNTNRVLPDGVYYYICDVYEQSLIGIEPRTIIGFVYIFTTESKSLE